MEIALALLMIATPINDRPRGGGLASTSAAHLNDDVELSLGNTSAAPDAKLIWDTSGTDQLQIWLTDCDGGGTDCVPLYWLTGTSTAVFGGDLDLKGSTITDSLGAAHLCGSGTPGHSAGTGDGYCAGKLVVDSTIYGDGSIYASSWLVSYVGILPGGDVAGRGGLRYATDEGLSMFLGNADGQGNRHLLIVDSANWAKDHDHDTQSDDPTVFLNSATDPDTANDEFAQWDWRSIKLGGDGGGLGCINETFAYDDMVDGGGASGTFTMTEQIPIGAVVQHAILHTLNPGFTGDVSATIQFGDGTDVDRYNTGTPSVFTAAAGGVYLGVPSGTVHHAAAATVTVTITTNADFTSVSAGQATVAICYWTP